MDHNQTVSGTGFQQRVAKWLEACLGSSRKFDQNERTHRMLEEALELAQACGCTRDDADRLVQYVFERPAGFVQQEVGGVMVTLAGLSSAMAVDMAIAADEELARNWSKIAEIRAKADAKPDDTPLPQ